MPTALIVEDEPEANKLLSMLVKLRGFTTVSAFTGREAIERAGECEPDVVFLDLMLPDINGYEVCRVLKSRHPTSGVPVVIVTARVAADNRLESFSNGADDYIPKPYTPDQIFDRLAQATAWKSDLNAPQIEGSITLERAGIGSLRQLARLRSLLIARTNLGFKTVEHIFAEIQGIRTYAERWAIDHPPTGPLALDYSLDMHHLRIRIRDHAGWIEDYRSRLPVVLSHDPETPRFLPERIDESTAYITLNLPLEAS